MQAVGKELEVPQEIVKESPERPACLVSIAMDWTAGRLPLSEAAPFVQRWVDDRLIREVQLVCMPLLMFLVMCKCPTDA